MTKAIYDDSVQPDNVEKSASSGVSKYIYNPLGMGLASIFSFAVFLLGTYNRITILIFLIFCVPVFSLIGLVFSFVTVRVIKGHVLVWILGLLSCLAGLGAFNVYMYLQMMAIAQQ